MQSHFYGFIIKIKLYYIPLHLKKNLKMIEYQMRVQIWIKKFTQKSKSNSSGSSVPILQRAQIQNTPLTHVSPSFFKFLKQQIALMIKQAYTSPSFFKLNLKNSDCIIRLEKAEIDTFWSFSFTTASRGFSMVQHSKGMFTSISISLLLSHFSFCQKFFC